MTTSTIRTAVIYVRISSDRDDNQLGVERQEEDCRKLCATKGWEVVQVYCDNNISAANPRKARPAYKRMLGDIAAGKVDAVVVWDEDRLHRQLIELLEFVQVCEAAGLTRLASVGGDTDLSDENALFILKMKGLVAEQEVAKTRRRIRREKQQRAEKGQPSGGGRRPFGYEPDRVTIRESEAREIRKAAARLLNGTSLYAIRHDWIDRGVPTATDKRTKDGKPDWNHQTIRGILIRPRTAGLREHQGQIIGKAVWDPILDGDTYEAVCALLKDKSRQPKAASREYPLRGVLTCAVCGERLVSLPREKGTKRYYGCRKDTANGCGKVIITASRVEDYVTPILITLAESDVALTLMQAEGVVQGEELRSLLTEKSSDEAALRQVDDDHYDGKLNREQWTRQRTRIGDRIDLAEQRIAALRGSSALGRLGKGLTEAWPTMSADDRRAVYLALVSEIKISPHPQVPGVPKRFEPTRLAFVWRSRAFVAACGYDEDTRTFNWDRVFELGDSGTLAKAIGMTPERFDQAFTLPIGVDPNEVIAEVKARLSQCRCAACRKSPSRRG